jgi:hypothetical protein
MISAVLLAINSADAAERAERIDALADLIAEGLCEPIYVGDFFAGIVDNTVPLPILPMLPWTAA